MDKLRGMISVYNSKIKREGKSKYAIRLLTTAILQTIGISLISSFIDNRYDKLPLKLLIVFIFLLIYNMFVGFFIIWKRL